MAEWVDGSRSMCAALRSVQTQAGGVQVQAVPCPSAKLSQQFAGWLGCLPLIALVPLVAQSSAYQIDQVEEEVEDVEESNNGQEGDDEEEEFVPGTQEREEAQNLFLDSTEGTSRRQGSEETEEIEDISTLI